MNARATEPVRVGIALLNWNQYADTARCLASLRESHFRPAIVLVFDNGSGDGSAERLKAEYPEIELVLGGENFGFSDGNNRAAKMLLDAGVDYVWILNNDTEVHPDCLGWLVQAMEADSGLGAVSAKIWFMGDGQSIGYAGGWISHWTFNSTFRGFREEDVGQYDEAADVDVLSGCCMLIRAEALRKIGLFNRAFFAYAEDIDWSLRAAAAGLRQRYVPRAILRHRMFGASRQGKDSGVPKSSPRVEYLLARNRFILVRLHTKPWSVRRGFALACHVFIRRLPRAVGLMLLSSRRAAGRAILQGLWAGWKFQPDPADSRL